MPKLDMLKYWSRFAGRVESMKQRERLMSLVAAVAVTYAVLDVALVSSTLGKQRQAAQELAQKRTDIRALGEKLQGLALGRAQDPDAANRKKLEDVKLRLSQLERELEQRSALLIAPERMRGVLEKFLASRPRLELVELKTLPPQIALDLSVAVALKSATAKLVPGGPPPVAPAGDSGSHALLFKHGVELTLRGGYLDLLDYLRAIESLPDRLYWDKLQLSVKEYPVATMKLTIYTVSMDKAWLLV